MKKAPERNFLLGNPLGDLINLSRINRDLAPEKL